MDDKTTLKILISGDVNGNFEQLFNRVSSVNRKSGPFDMVLCAGDFFGPDCDKEYYELIHGSLQLPSIPIYILGPSQESLCKYYRTVNDEEVSDFNSGFELTDGLIYLGKKGILTSSNGVKIAYLSGTESSSDTKFTFNKDDYQSLIISHQSSSSVIDILLTYQWPKHIFRYSEGHPKELEQMNDQMGSDLISTLSRHLRPRYHFAASYGSYYERHPYRNHQVLVESARHVTRFISLGNVGNKSKVKWLYAFSLSPAHAMDKSELNKQPIDVTENPFNNLNIDVSVKQKTQYATEKTSQFFYDLNTDNDQQMSYRNKKRHQNRDDHQNRKQRSHPPQPKDPCWFCLSSPEVEKHLIISIGDHCYLAMAKGGLTDDHLLILPIGHYRSTVEIAENEEINNEMTKFKSALIDYFDSKGFCVVFFERNFKSSHLQIQVVPVPKDKAQQLKSLLLDIAEERALKFNELPDNCELNEMLNPGIPYFYIEVPKGKLFIKIKSGDYFPLQLGRELLAHSSILNCDNKIDWKQCALSKEESSTIANKIRKEFESFDFTLM